MAKRPIYLTAACLIIAWALMVSYQIFTSSALLTVAAAVSGPLPLVGSWLRSGSVAAGFIFGFAWMFVLSAIVENLMFGKEKRLSFRFMVSFSLTLAGSVVLGLLDEAGLNLADPTVLSGPFTAVFGNAVFAFFYLALPFIFMVAMDFRSMRKHK